MHAVYARINRRVRLVGDGLVATMAHLWSKFTKCLRPSKGASDPGPLPSPNVVPPSAQCRAIRYYYVVVITTSRKQRRSFLFSSIVRSSPRLFTSLLFVLYVHICISSLCNLPSNLKLFRL